MRNTKRTIIISDKLRLALLRVKCCPESCKEVAMEMLKETIQRIPSDVMAEIVLNYHNAQPKYLVEHPTKCELDCANYEGAMEEVYNLVDEFMNLLEGETTQIRAYKWLQDNFPSEIRKREMERYCARFAPSAYDSD